MPGHDRRGRINIIFITLIKDNTWKTLFCRKKSIGALLGQKGHDRYTWDPMVVILQGKNVIMLIYVQARWKLEGLRAEGVTVGIAG